MEAFLKQPPEEVTAALEASRQLVCVGHVTPDADCLGAMLAFARAWATNGCRISVCLPAGGVSERLAFLCEWSEVSSARRADLDRADTILVVDTAKESRLNLPADAPAQWRSKKKLVNVDHHVSNTRFGDANWIVDDAASSSELIYALLVAGGRKIDAITASLLYAGVYTDTVGFSVSSTRPETLRVAADLVERGARVGDLGERINRSQGERELDLRRVILNNTRLAAGDEIAYSTASYDEIVGAGCTAADIDDQVNIPRSLKGIRIAILFTEGVKGRTRMNFRGEQGTRVLELARQFGGGGHAEAAGAVLDCAVDKAVARVIPAATEALRRQQRAVSRIAPSTGEQQRRASW